MRAPLLGLWPLTPQMLLPHPARDRLWRAAQMAQAHTLVLCVSSQGQEQVDLNKLKPNQYLVEAVVASRSPMVHRRVSELQLRTRYRAAIVAVHRHGTRLARYPY